MKIVVLDAATLGEDLSLEVLKTQGELVVYKSTPADLVAERISDADVAIVNKVKLFEQNLCDAKNLSLICVAATGYDNIDIDYCRQKGIGVSNVVGYSTHSVAQVTLSIALSLFTHINEYSNSVRDGSYSNGAVANILTPVYHEICGKTWGVVGLGNIGKQVARVAEAMGCRVLAYKRIPDENYNCVSLEQLCRESDIISVHLPLSADTRAIIDDKCLSVMKKEAVLINMARGAVLDEAAVAKAVLDKKIAAFGADVYSTEPMPTDHPFNSILKQSNVILTPHMAWGAYEARVRCLGEIVENIKAFKRGISRNRRDE
jgi:glycerate dehydrogenase